MTGRSPRWMSCTGGTVRPAAAASFNVATSIIGTFKGFLPNFEKDGLIGSTATSRNS